MERNYRDLALLGCDKYYKLFPLEKYFCKQDFNDAFRSEGPPVPESTVVTGVNGLIDGRSSVTSSGSMDSAWPMKCHDTRHTGRSPYSTADNNGVEKWRFKTDDWVEGSPVISDEGTVYFGDFDGYLYALYPNGTLKWKYKTGGWISSAPAIAEDGTIFAGSWDDYLYAINPNGTLKWKINSGGTISSSPAIANDGTIYFGTMREWDKGDVYAVNPDGTEKWHYTTDYYITSDPAIGADGTIYIGSGDTYFYALYPNGTLRWQFKTGDWIKAAPSIAEDGTIHIGSFDGYLYALNPDGSLKWKCRVGSGTETNPSIASDGTIYVGSDKLYAIYPNGTTKWSFDPGGNRFIHQSSPAISADGTIYFGTVINIGASSGGEIMAVNPDGTEKWRSEKIADFQVQSSPCIGKDGTVYIGSASDDDAGYSYGCLYAFGTGELKAFANGPYFGLINEPVQFKGGAAGGRHPYSWHWGFGDDSTSDEQNPTHVYKNPGNYTVILTVIDNEYNTSSDTSWALIKESNDHPEKPTIDGPTSGKAGNEYKYRFSASDPEKHNVLYYIDWGDDTNSGWIGPYDSGEEITLSHSWDEKGTYTIRAKAKDAFDAESDWATFEVSMPKNKELNNLSFLQLLEKITQRFPILEQIFFHHPSQ